jgi:hypothetical protein
VTHPRPGAAVGAVAVVLILMVSLLGAAGAEAAPSLHCEASPLRATLGGTQSIEPVTQGRNAPCASAEAVPSLSTPLLSASALTARTAYDAATPAGAATGGVANLQVLPAPEVLAAGRQQIVDAINALPLTPVTLPGLPLPPLPPLPTTISLDLRAALISLIPPGATSLLSADVLTAQANVRCQAGSPTLSGSSTIAGVKALGLGVDLDGPLNRLLPLIDSRSVSLSEVLNTGLVTISPGGIPVVGSLLTDTLAAVPLNAPPIEIPAALASVQLTPNEQTRAGASLTQRALRASISLGGQPVLDAVLGEARVAADDGACPVPAAPAKPAPAAPAKTPAKDAGTAGQGVADQLLACSDRKLVLVDVLKQGGRVKLLGAADRRYVGRRVAIRLRRGNRIVAHATVRKDGSFQTTAPMPPRAVMASHTKANTLRYRAEIGKERSLPLKLQRRLIVDSLTSKAGRVTITGHVVRPLTTPVATIRLVRRVSCHKVVLVKRFKPNADGTFRVTVKAPKGQAAAVYRMATSVREKPSNPRSYPTFTLPRGVALNTR